MGPAAARRAVSARMQGSTKTGENKDATGADMGESDVDAQAAESATVGGYRIRARKSDVRYNVDGADSFDSEALGSDGERRCVQDRLATRARPCV